MASCFLHVDVGAGTWSGDARQDLSQRLQTIQALETVCPYVTLSEAYVKVGGHGAPHLHNLCHKVEVDEWHARWLASVMLMPILAVSFC